MRGCRGRATTCSGWRDAAIALGFAIGFVSGCARFTPSMPTAARSGVVELRLQHLRLPPRREMTFESHSTVPHQLRRGWVTVGTRAPCDGGAEIVGIAIDGAVGDGLLPPGAHELSVKFEDRLVEF
jgi:hypothetical protein